MVGKAVGLLVSIAAFLGTVPIRGNAPPEDLTPIAALISLGIFCFRLGQHCLTLAALSPDLLCCYKVTFCSFIVFFELAGSLYNWWLVCCNMSGNLLVIYCGVWERSFFSLLQPLSPNWWADMVVETLSDLVSKSLGLIRVTQGQPILEISTFCWQYLSFRLCYISEQCACYNLIAYQVTVKWFLGVCIPFRT